MLLVRIQLYLQEFSLKVEPIAYTYQTGEHYPQLLPRISLRVEHGTDTSDTVEHYHHPRHWALGANSSTYHLQ